MGCSSISFPLNVKTPTSSILTPLLSLPLTYPLGNILCSYGFKLPLLYDFQIYISRSQLWIYRSNFLLVIFTKFSISTSNSVGPKLNSSTSPKPLKTIPCLSWWHYHQSMTKPWIIPDPWASCPNPFPNPIRHRCSSLFLINPLPFLLSVLYILGCILSHLIYCKSPVFSTSPSLHDHPAFLFSLVLHPVFSGIPITSCCNDSTCLPKLTTPGTKQMLDKHFLYNELMHYWDHPLLSMQNKGLLRFPLGGYDKGINEENWYLLNLYYR